MKFNEKRFFLAHGKFHTVQFSTGIILFSFVCLCSGSDKITSNCKLKYSLYVGHTIGRLYNCFKITRKFHENF